MTRPTSQLLSLVGLMVIVAGMIVGCDPAPSTPLAPDQKMPQMSAEDIAKQVKKNNETPGKR